MPFKAVFISVTIGTALIVAAFILNAQRPGIGNPAQGGAFLAGQPSATFVSATGKCAACHRHETAAVVHQYPAPQPGVYLAWVFFGSPASQYRLPTTRRIVEVDGVPTPDLASFIECVRGRADRSAVRVAMLSLEGRSEVATLKLDLEHWPTTLLRRGDDGWQRIPIDISRPPE